MRRGRGGHLATSFLDYLPKADHSARIGELQREVGNLTEAIASGLLKSSPALAKRLTVTESELSRLQAERDRKLPALGNILPRIGERYLEIVEQLEEGLRGDPELARAALTDAIGSRITLEPDESGKFLWAEFGLETTPQLVAVGLPEFMVAGAATSFIARTRFVSRRFQPLLQRNETLCDGLHQLAELSS
jgi:hypothetical protein